MNPQDPREPLDEAARRSDDRTVANTDAFAYGSTYRDADRYAEEIARIGGNGARSLAVWGVRRGGGTAW